MQVSDKFKIYSSTVCDQIRWNKAHAVIAEEIENHLIDQRDAYVTSGEDESAATDHAIVQMGDPVLIGTQLDRTHRPKPQWRMLFLTAALLFIGLFIRMAVLTGGDWDHPLPKQLLFIAAGLVMMAAAYFADFTLIGKYPKTFFLTVMAATLLIVLVSPMRFGQRYYAVYMSMLSPLAFSAVIFALRNKGYLGLVVCGLAFLLPCLLALIAPTVSGIMLFVVCGLTLMLIAVAKNWFGIRKLYGYIIITVPVVLIIVLVLANVSSSTQMRFLAAFNPAVDPDGAGFMSMIIREIIAGSKFIGPGDITSIIPGSYTQSPAAYTLLLLTNLIFKAGWIAFVVVIGVLLFFIVQGFLLCFRQKSGLGLFVSVSVMLTFTAQVFGYVMYNLGITLTDPISLPLISYGNVAMVFNLFLLGVMMSVFRTGDMVRDKKVITGQHKRPSFIAWDDGRLIISLGGKH